MTSFSWRSRERQNGKSVLAEGLVDLLSVLDWIVLLQLRSARAEWRNTEARSRGGDAECLFLNGGWMDDGAYLT